MAIAAAHLTTSSDTSNISTYTTASITPTGNALVLAWIANTLAAGPSTPALSGNGITWVEITPAVDFDTIASPSTKLSLFRGMVAAPSAGAVSIDFGGVNQSGCGWSISEFTGVDTSGANGAGAIDGISATAVSNNATDLTVTLAAFESGDNRPAAGFATSLNGLMTPETGWALLGEAGHATPALHIGTEWLATSADTTAFMDWPGSPAAAGIAVKIRALRYSAQTVQLAESGGFVGTIYV